MSRKKTISERIDAIEKRSEQIEVIKKIYEAKENDIYWSIKDIAAYVKQSERTVRRNLISQPNWPKAVQFGENKTKRWLASEVKKTILMFREEN